MDALPPNAPARPETSETFLQRLRGVFRFAWPFFRPYRVRMALGVAFGVAFGLINASFVWGTKTLFERLESPQAHSAANVAAATPAPERLAQLNLEVKSWLDEWLPRAGRKLDWPQALGGLLLLPLLVGLRGAMSYGNAYCLEWASVHAVRDLKLAAHRQLQRLSLDYFTARKIGDHTMILNTGVGALNTCMRYGVSDAVKEPCTLLSIAVALIVLDWQLALLGLLFLPLSLLPIGRIARKLRRVAVRGYEAGAGQDSLMVEVYGNPKTVKAYGLERWQLGRFADLYGRLARVGLKQMQARSLQNPLIEFIGVAGLGAVVVFVFYTGKTVPELVGFLTGLLMLYQPLKKLAHINTYYQEASVGVGMLQRLFSAEPTVREKAGALAIPPLARELAMERVGFAYEREPVLRGLDLVVRKGTRLGVAGESGTGKSTLASLLLRLYDPQSGRITVDGVDLRDASFASVRGQMALVSQEVVVFDQTVAENIACGRLEASREEIIAAARSAHAHEFIMQLPQGYDTRLGEQGTRLSGGQRQRIAIARAFVRQAPILILDEATASLDSNAEAEVQAALEKLEEGRTVICVAHRLSTLRGMDQIIVLEEGRVIEQGAFEELLRRDGVFARMARRQGITAGGMAALAG